MPELDERIIEAISKLIEQTHDRTLEWESAEPPENVNVDPDEQVGTAFLATHGNTHLRLYERGIWVEVAPVMRTLTSLKPYWQTSAVLEVVDTEGNVIWKFPPLAPLNDLLKAVQFQVAGVDDFINGLLGE